MHVLGTGPFLHTKPIAHVLASPFLPKTACSQVDWYLAMAPGTCIMPGFRVTTSDRLFSFILLEH